ncbi:hypothetical protein chiPu_0014009 [Chiloscyllium punctatum]|uniref:Uncharacterized protein n=1 Tax=Chiloscyllium punctatum TaxID=137246 RepID=A0A401SYP6_CHIPU|nr:hypothetical protein [Chiloscyllium punctatum]
MSEWPEPIVRRDPPPGTVPALPPLLTQGLVLPVRLSLSDHQSAGCYRGLQLHRVPLASSTLSQGSTGKDKALKISCEYQRMVNLPPFLEHSVFKRRHFMRR